MKSDRFWIVVFVSVICICAAAEMLLSFSHGSTAHIYSGGELIETIDLNAITRPYMITVYGSGGGFNTIEIEPGRIRVFEAQCAGGDCVRQGWISGAATPIICLPNKLIIKIDSAASSDIDAVTG